MAQVIQYTHQGPPEVLELREVPTPRPGDGEILVELHAVGVNPIEWRRRSGDRELLGAAPHRLGEDGAGVVVAVGSDVQGLHPGDRVIIERAHGTYASHLALTPDHLTPLPADLSFDQGAALGTPVSTAYQSLISLGIARGETLLVHGGSGAVGQASIQFARLWGARVIATARPANFERIAALGGEPVAYGPGLADRLRRIAPDGIDLSLDAAGTDEALAVSLESTSTPRRIATIVRGDRATALGIRAFSGGSPEPLSEHELTLRREALPVAIDLVRDGRFDVEIAATYPLARAADAHRASESGAHRGKIILRPSPADG